MLSKVLWQQKKEQGDGKPVSGQGGIFLKSPDVFQLRYLHNGADHPFLNSFKHCALTGMSSKLYKRRYICIICGWNTSKYTNES